MFLEIVGFPDSSVDKGSTFNAGDLFDFWIGKICWRRDKLPTPVFLDFPGGTAGKESICNAGDLGSISGLGRSPGEFHGLYSPWSHKESDMTEQLSLFCM